MHLVDVIAEKRTGIREICLRHGAANIHLFSSPANFDGDPRLELIVRFVEPKAGLAYFRAIASMSRDLQQLLGRSVHVVDDKVFCGNAVSVSALNAFVHLSVH